MCETPWLIQKFVPLNQRHWENDIFLVKYAQAVILWHLRLKPDAQEVFI